MPSKANDLKTSELQQDLAISAAIDFVDFHVYGQKGSVGLVFVAFARCCMEL